MSVERVSGGGSVPNDKVQRPAAGRPKRAFGEIARARKNARARGKHGAKHAGAKEKEAEAAQRAATGESPEAGLLRARLAGKPPHGAGQPGQAAAGGTAEGLQAAQEGATAMAAGAGGSEGLEGFAGLDPHMPLQTELTVRAGGGAFAEKLKLGKLSLEESEQRQQQATEVGQQKSERVEQRHTELDRQVAQQHAEKRIEHNEDTLRRQVRVEQRHDEFDRDRLRDEVKQQLFAGEVTNPLLMQRVQELAAAAPTEPVKPVEIPQEVIDRVVERVRFGQTEDGAHEFQIDLKQEVLQGAQLKVRTEGGRVLLEMISDDPLVQAQLEQHAQALVRSMRERGLEPELRVLSREQAEVYEQERRAARRPRGAAGGFGTPGA
ncbi:MAG: hypothetical protein D6776_07565 [Planctomycetota bacterium]|nr:MAG: hypothetical protein D6776_07565 [Planctomycetota bacterium]